jgi:adenylate kinase family enzyme
MLRTNVIGTTGAGKSTFAAALAARMGTPVVELDELYWLPGWQPMQRDEFRNKVAMILAVERWVACGNYSAARDIVWGRADTVVWLDYPLPLILYRLYSRTWRRLVTQEELWGGNRETWRTQFLSRDSLFVWALRTHHRRRREVPALLVQGEYRHLQLLRFRRPGEAQVWLDSLPAP